MQPLEHEKLTWSALLGRWIEFAQSAVALPDNAEGRAWKRAVPEIIGLQAVAMALSEADQLDDDERALGLDRARLLVAAHTEKLVALFGEDLLHPQLMELIDDANAAIRRAEPVK